MVAITEGVEDWFFAMIDGVVTQITIGKNLGRGKYSVAKDRLSRFDYRIVDASEIICLAVREKNNIIIDALLSGYSRENVS